MNPRLAHVPFLCLPVIGMSSVISGSAEAAAVVTAVPEPPTLHGRRLRGRVR
ncbi:MAG: hypothetical protein KA756_12275 [Steroidobacteraceae bacterium]|nr:hypothetical protein [Steroidobacteraceae bacterium]